MFLKRVRTGTMTRVYQGHLGHVSVWLLLVVSSLSCLPVVGGATLALASSNLKCYDCSESFSRHWEPFTPCQSNLSAVHIRLCHPEDKYCKVDRTTVKGMTTSVSRGCSGECIYGCRAFGYGITQTKCTSCCLGSLCNTDNAGCDVSTQAVALLTAVCIACHLLM